MGYKWIALPESKLLEQHGVFQRPVKADGMEYRVVRVVTPTVGEDKPFTEIVWQGTDPADYTGGIGCFDNGDAVVNCQWQSRTVLDLTLANQMCPRYGCGLWLDQCGHSQEV